MLLISNQDTILGLEVSSNYFATIVIESRKLKISKSKIKFYLLPAYKNILHINQPKSKKRKKKKKVKEKREKILY